MTEMDYNGLEEHLQNLVSAQGSDSDVSITQISGADSISASINHLDGNISFEVPTTWDPLQYQNIKRFTERLNLRNPRKKVLEDVAFHEVGHHKLKNDSTGLGCPEDLKGKEITVDAVSKAMIEAGKFSQQGALYLENVISDIIDNLNCSNYAHLNGLSMFFAEQGELNNRKLSPLYESFVKLNMDLWGRKKQKQLLSNYYTNDENVDEVVKDCIQDVGLTENKQNNLKLLFNKQRWHQTFYKFARHLVKLMDESAPESLPGSGSGSKGYKVPEEFEDGEFDPEEIDDSVMKRVLDNDNMKKVMMRRNEEGDSLPSFVENWRALDYFYQAHASELYIKAESPKKGHSMPIAPVQARKFDSDKDRLEDILFGKLLLDENGKPCLAIPRSYVEITQHLKKSIKSYPELNIAVLDTSISMAQGANSKGQGNTNIVPWGDNSKYHYSVLAYYGVVKALHRMGVAIKTKYNLITFANTTDSTGEKGYEDRSQIKKRILQPNFGSITKINGGVLKRSARQPGSVLMTISDGEIWNWDSVKDDFKNTISDKFYVHFQIGEDSQATRDIENWGATVVRITDASEMPKKAIDITQNFYRSFASGDRK
ncbi:MAG: hypothetical protein U9Q69_04150 [Nanoarchaeota archaeon]|nr:hypothetical protein [Nanoarchaeota archaeon]